ncbi:MAG: 2-phosphosulfolactate phosphatase [Bacteroidia bacterium]|nr:2-phosphosulfolactate phosphatase [Bacteroidia bacterium]
MKKIEICFTPALYNLYHNTQANVVVIDIMRATTSICAAFAAGADKIIPVGTVEDAKKMKEAGYILAAERDGIVLDFADFGNSPNLFTPERVKGKTIAYSTTNGTQAINMAKDSKHVIIGAFINLSEVVRFLISDNSDVVIFCSGWKKKFNIEDTLCAGAIATKLIESGKFSTICDSSYASIDLWNIAKDDIMTYIEKAAHRHRLRGIVSDEIVEYCHTLDVVKVLPMCKNEVITDYLAK